MAVWHAICYETFCNNYKQIGRNITLTRHDITLTRCQMHRCNTTSTRRNITPTQYHVSITVHYLKVPPLKCRARGHMEILLEYKGSHRQLQIADPKDVYETIEELLNKTGWSEFLFLALCSESHLDLAEITDVYFLQQWSHKWGTFVDVADLLETQTGDRLTVVAKPTKSPTKVLSVF